MVKGILVCAVVFSMLSASGQAQEASDAIVEWSNVTAAGSGCPAGEAVITVSPNGNEISWTAPNFGFSLRSPSATSKFCRLSASAAVKPGYYLDAVWHEVSYGRIKSTEGSSFSIGEQSRFFGFNMTPINRSYPSGTAFNIGKLTLYRIQNFQTLAPADFFCGGKNPAGLFQATVSANGQVEGEFSTAEIGTKGQTIGYKAMFRWSPCNS